ncbi:MAG: hypothetical protein ACLFR8_12880 [Alkalispirochaeta sp.]
MKRYRIRTMPGQRAFLDIVSDLGDDYRVRITRCFEGYDTTEEQTMTKHLFDLCVRTDYLVPDAATDRAGSAAVGAAS